MLEWNDKEIPRTLGPDEATQLIVDCDAAIMSGVDESGRTQAISKCMQCGVKFASKRFRACPICSVRNAEQVDLQNSGGIRRSADITQQLRLTPGYHKKKRSWLYDAIFSLVFATLFVSLCWAVTLLIQRVL